MLDIFKANLLVMYVADKLNMSEDIEQPAVL